MLGAVGERVGDQTHRRAGRIDVGPPCHVLLQDVVLNGATEQLRVDPVLFGHQLVEEQENGGGGVDGHRRGDLIEREAGQQQPHVSQRVDGHANLPHFALGAGMIRIEPHLGREVERTRKPGLSGPEEELEPLIGRGGITEPGVLPHGPQAPPVHVGADPPGIGVTPRLAQLLGRIPAVQISRAVDRSDLDPRVGVSLSGVGRRGGRGGGRGLRCHM